MFLTSNAVGKKTSNNNVFNIKKYPENMVIRCLKHGLGLVTDVGKVPKTTSEAEGGEGG